MTAKQKISVLMAVTIFSGCVSFSNNPDLDKLSKFLNCISRAVYLIPVEDPKPKKKSKPGSQSSNKK